MGRSEQDISILCPNARVLKGLPIVGASVQTAENEIANWLVNLLSNWNLSGCNKSYASPTLFPLSAPQLSEGHDGSES
jgi:hypothetical protein